MCLRRLGWVPKKQQLPTHTGAAEGVLAMHDQFDVTLEDADLLGEVEMTTNLIIAASETDEQLSNAQIDAILGVNA